MPAYSIAVLFERLCSFGAVFIFSRLLSVHDFGFYVLVIAVGKFCDYTTMTWLRVGFLRVYHPGNINDQERHPNITAIYLASLSCCAVGILICWPISFFLVHDRWVEFALVTSIYLIGNAAGQSALSTLRGEMRASLYAVIEVLRPCTSLAAGMLAAKFLAPTFVVVSGFFFGMNAITGIIALSVIWFQRFGSGGQNYVKEIMGHSWPLVFSCILISTLNTTDRYQLQWWLGPSAVALYSAAYAIGRQPIDILFNGMNLGVFTELMKTYDTAGSDAAARLLSSRIVLMLAMALPFAVSSSLLAPEILHVFFDHRYWNGTPPLIPIFVLTGIFAGLKNIGFDQGFYMVHKIGMQVYSLMPAVVIGVGASAILINLYGLPGAAYGELLGFSISLVLAAWFVRRLLPIQLPLFELAKVFVAAIVMGLTIKFVAFPGAGQAVSLALRISFAMTVYLVSVLSLDVLDARHNFRAAVMRMALPKRASSH